MKAVRAPQVSHDSMPVRKRSGATLAAFLIGIPLAAGILGGVLFGASVESPAQPYFQKAQRYIKHPVEGVEVLLFSCALGALLAKFWALGRERRACRLQVLPSWDGHPVPVEEAGVLLAAVSRLPRRLQHTTLARRLHSVLDFLCRRGSAAELDDQLRALADNDALALENSYSLVRFITWAIPILGFLGTVLGITGAISGVTPEVLEKSLSTVTDGLALAFDATALALGLTMITMFCTFLVERAEQGIIEAVDAYVDLHLAHRFQRTQADSGPIIAAVQQSTQIMVQTTEELVRRQVELWARSMEQADQRRIEMDREHQLRLTRGLEEALQRSLELHDERLAALEKQSLDQGSGLLDRLATLTLTVRDQQVALARVAEALATQTAALSRLQEGETLLLNLQETLNRNLTTLTGAGAFEEAVHSLTAAVHLLTARSSAPPSLGAAGQPARRPGAAA
jgi:hypothetical protein